MRKVNKAGLDLIKSFEGLELKAYQDSVGVWTIGYGHTEGVKKGDVITREEANRIFEEDINEFAAGVEKVIHHTVTDNQFAAMVSLAFNVGLSNFSRSTLLRYVNAGRTNDAAEQFIHWNRAGGQVLNGLTRRRKAERALFLDKPIPERAAVVNDIQPGEALDSSPTPVLPPAEEQTTTLTLKDGELKAEINAPAPTPERVVIEKPEPVGFIKGIKKKLGIAGGTNLGIQALRDQFDTAKGFGFSPRFWMWVSIIGVVGAVIWIAIEWFHHLQAHKRELEITKSLVAANTTPTNQVELLSKEEIAQIDEKKGVKIVRR